jgi:hypothetical protein
VREIGFRIAATGAAVAAAIHVAALTIPVFARSAYPPGYPAWRHVLFVLIDTALAWLLVKRPRWLLWPYAVLTAQVMLGHGVHAWRSWTASGRVAWLDAAAVIGVLLILVLLIADRGAAQRGL